MQKPEQTLKFGWTYASLENYDNGQPDGIYLLDSYGCKLRLATDVEETFAEWLTAGHIWQSGNDFLISVDEHEVPRRDDGSDDDEIREMITEGHPLSTLTIDFENLEGEK